MRKNSLILAFTFALLLIYSVTLCHAFKLPDTGQTKCYPAVSPYYGQIPCAGSGQDGANIINPMSYTDNNNGTVTDNNTRLMWQQQGNSFDFFSNNWYTASGTYDPAYNPNSISLCGSLNLGGYADWRLPSKKELITLVDYSFLLDVGPAINPVFTNTLSSSYWSSNSYVQDPSYAWFVGFVGGWGVNRGIKYNGAYIRCVRGEPYASEIFLDNGNGTVTDKKTGLMWQQSEPGTMTWDSALAYCGGLSAGGNADWRLPNIKELESLTDEIRFDPATDVNFFPNAHTFRYWTSTSLVDNPAIASWCVDFSDGSVSSDHKYFNYNVRCVRSGQPGPVQSVTVPTMTEWGMILFMLLAGFGSIYSIRHLRRR